MVDTVKRRDPRVAISPAYARAKRTLRRPQHPFQVRTRPFQLQPMMIAPVLPGETLQNLLLQARVITDPIVHPLIGWWKEYYFFYVKHRDLEYHAGHLRFQDMVLNPAANLSDLHVAANVKTNHTYGIDFLQECMETITEFYFRDEGQAWNAASLDGLPLVKVNHNSWLDSATLSADKRADREVNMDLDADGIVEASEMDDALQHWHALRDAGLVTMDYEDWLRTYGVAIAQPEASPEVHKPELVRYIRQWQYPSNTIDPTTGTPSSAVAWSIAERADKQRFFKEPGFLVGFTCTRPKVYMGNVAGSLTGSMDDVYTWLPAILHQRFEKSFRSFTESQGPLAATMTTGYWVDMRDLFMYGEQFTNFAIAADANASKVALPTATMGKMYPDATSIDALFKGTAKTIREDGIVHLGISGRQKDMTPQPIL